MHQPIFNFSCRKVGGIWFFKLGRLCLSFCVTRPTNEQVDANMDNYLRCTLPRTHPARPYLRR